MPRAIHSEKLLVRALMLIFATSNRFLPCNVMPTPMPVMHTYIHTYKTLHHTAVVTCYSQRVGQSMSGLSNMAARSETSQNSSPRSQVALLARATRRRNTRASSSRSTIRITTPTAVMLHGTWWPPIRTGASAWSSGTLNSKTALTVNTTA